jgi:hypothetical protein
MSCACCLYGMLTRNGANTVVWQVELAVQGRGSNERDW